MSVLSPCIILPSYNSGPALTRTIRRTIPHGIPVFVVIDGSTDGSDAELRASDLAEKIVMLTLPGNSGKGGAVLVGLRAAREAGHTHALIMDADGQHDPRDIPRFVELLHQHPRAMILGVPIFGADAPIERVKGRRIGNCFAEIETHGLGVRDSLFGYRMLPVAPSIRILESITTARRFDFDTELVVRLVWAGVRPISLRTRVYYPKSDAGGVTHFRYLRDNLLLIGTHARLLLGMVSHLPDLLTYRRKWR